MAKNKTTGVMSELSTVNYRIRRINETMEFSLDDNEQSEILRVKFKKYNIDSNNIMLERYNKDKKEWRRVIFKD